MSFIIAMILVFGFIFGQIMWLRPSARDSQLMALREQARKLGLHPRLLPPPSWYRGERPVGGMLACYSITADVTPKGGFAYFRADRLLEGDWYIREGDKTALNDISINDSLSDVFAIEAQGNHISVWWHERTKTDTLPDMNSLFRQLSQKMNVVKVDSESE